MPLKGNEGSAATTAELATELEQIVRERMVGDGVISFTISLSTLLKLCRDLL